MRYVENEGALFRIVGPSNAFPDEVWNVAKGAFVPYEGDTPKPQGWGSDVSDEEANEIMGGKPAAEADPAPAAETAPATAAKEPV